MADRWCVITVCGEDQTICEIKWFDNWADADMHYELGNCERDPYNDLWSRLALPPRRVQGSSTTKV